MQMVQSPVPVHHDTPFAAYRVFGLSNFVSHTQCMIQTFLLDCCG